MLSNISANKWINAAVLVCIVSYLYIMATTLQLSGTGDDQYWLSIFNSGQVIEKAIERYSIWSGRVPIELLMTSTIGIIIFWKVAIPTSIVVLCYSICRIANNNFGLMSFAASLVLFLSIPNPINQNASWWVTGFYNYLLPVALSIYAFSVSYVNSNVKLEKIFCIIAAFFFSYMEQAGISYVVAMVVLLSSRKDTRQPFNIFMLFISVVNLIVSLKAPGNENRLMVETWSWYPQYQTYGLIHKLSLGFDKLHQLMTFRYNFPLIGFSAVLFCLRSVSGKMPLSIKIAMSIIMSFIAISITNSLTGFFSTESFFYNTTLHASRWASGKIFLSYLYLWFVICSMFIIMLDMLANKHISLTPIISMLLGFMTVTMMGMSPTVYASDVRVNFPFEIMCIISCMYLFKRYSTQAKNTMQS